MAGFRFFPLFLQRDFFYIFVKTNKMDRLNEIIKTMKSKGYVIYTQPYKLNIVGVRNGMNTSINFDDELAFFYYDDSGRLSGKVCPATTDPSIFYLKDPMVSVRDKGTAILKSGQYIDTYKIDWHGSTSKYLALCQRLRPVIVIRDNDRNDLLNFFADTESGFFGINIHRASRNKNNVAEIGPDSAGCQVFQNEADFDEMMRLANISSERYGNVFTYTLIDNRDIFRKIRNYSSLGIILLILGLGGYLISRKK
jgi:hypothetical protein